MSRPLSAMRTAICAWQRLVGLSIGQHHMCTGAKSERELCTLKQHVGNVVSLGQVFGGVFFAKCHHLVVGSSHGL